MLEEVEEGAEIMSANLVGPEDSVTSCNLGDPSRWEGGVVLPHQAVPSWPGKDEPQLRLLGAACGDSNDTAHPPPPGSHSVVPGLGHHGHLAESPRVRSPQRPDSKAGLSLWDVGSFRTLSSN